MDESLDGRVVFVDEEEASYVVHFFIADDLAAKDRCLYEGVRDEMPSFFFISPQGFGTLTARVDQNITS
jgi:hypothetical protein